MFFSQHFSFPCQYHSTIAPYSFIQLPPTLYNVFLSALQFSPVSIIPPSLHNHSFTYHPHYFSFPLSVSFHHCSILIHPPTTHTTSVFPCQYHSTIAPYSSIQLQPTLLQFSSVCIIPPSLHNHLSTYHPHYFSFPLSVSFHHAELNPTGQLLALLGAHHILHISIIFTHIVISPAPLYPTVYDTIYSEHCNILRETSKYPS